MKLKSDHRSNEKNSFLRQIYMVDRHKTEFL